MKYTLRYITIFVISGIIAGFLVFTSMAFNKNSENREKNLNNSNEIQFFLPKNLDGKLENMPIWEENITKNEIFSADFGRLTSWFFVKNTEEKTGLSRQEKTIFSEKIRGIFSWYDPFDVYTLVDSAKNFSFQQITSGSFYISYEEDGTIILYSVDMVGELSFLYENSLKTKMIIFPGMYFRFDPSVTGKMKENADLLQIIQLQWGSDKNTAIAFINPRIEIADAKQDVIVPFILKQAAGQLFDYLRLASKNRVQTVESLKQYITTSKRTFSADDIMNPTKKMYRLLGELQIIFSQAINSEISVEEFRAKIQEILKKTEEFELENTAKKMIEQFLIDGRFALFMSSNDANIHYQKLYDEAANILGITPTTGKWKMFQVLSNIFSKNVLEDKMSANQIPVDTVSLLNTTFSQSQKEIENSDYFDMSLYVFLMLRTMPDAEDPLKGASFENNSENETMSLGLSVFSKMLLGRLIIEKESIYKMYATIFSATQRYANGLTDSNQKNNAQTALATDFYSPMLYLLVNSLYQTYTIQENGMIFLNVAYINRGIPELSTYNHSAIVNNLTNTHAMMQEIYQKNIANNANMSAVSRLEIEKYITQLKGFIDMIDEEKYQEYQKNPYVVEKNSVLPLYNAQTRMLIKKPLSVWQEEKNPKNASETITQTPMQNNPNTAQIEKISKMISVILGISAENEKIALMQNENYQVEFFAEKKKVNFLINTTNNSVTNLQITENRVVEFGEKMPMTQLRVIIMNFPLYNAQIEKILAENPQLVSEKIVINVAQKKIFFGKKSFPLS